MSELVVDHIYKSFDNDPVLRDISFFAHEGEFISILGPSGSGKSTLFKVIGGITRQDAGEIYINGERITGKCGYISYMPQSAALMPWRTVLDNVMLGQEIAGRRDPAKAMEMLERAGLKGYEKRLPHQLSGGMKQRVSFIRSLLSPQTLICLDEPFSALDEFTRFDMQKWLLSIWQEYSKTILFVTHNIEEALFLSDRLIILSAKPAQIKKVWQIPFERPRAEQLLYTNEFLQWKKMIYEEIKQG